MNLDTLLKILQLFFDLFRRKKKTVEEIKDEAKDEVADSSLDDDIADINDSLRNHS
jgi:hypothetical protein